MTASRPNEVVYGVNPRSAQYQSANRVCQHLIPGMSAPPPLTAPQLRGMIRDAACMRAHGFPDWPDPEVRNGQLVGNPVPAGINMSSPQFLAAVKACHGLGLG